MSEFSSAAELRGALEAWIAQGRASDIVSLMRVAGRDPRVAFAGGDWRRVNFAGLDLRDISFHAARLHRANVNGADVSRCDFRAADISGVNLHLARNAEHALLDPEQRRWLESLGPVKIADFVWRIEQAQSLWDAQDVYEEMLAADLPHNKFALTALLDQTRQPVDAERIYRMFIDNDIEIDTFALNTFMTKLKKYRSVRAVFSGLAQRGLTRDLYSYNILLNTEDNFERDDWLAKMRVEGPKPDRITYNILITRSESFEEALEYVECAEIDRTALALVEYEALIRQCERNAEYVHQAIDRLMTAGFKIAQTTFNACITQARDFDEAWTVIEQMQAAGFKPDVHTGFALINLASTIEEGLTQLACLADVGVNVVANDIVKLLVRKLPETDRRYAREHLVGDESGFFVPREGLTVLVRKYVAEDRHDKMLARLLGTRLSDDA